MRFFRIKIKAIDIPCLGHGSFCDDYDCDYEKADGITCEDCVCNFGYISPKTGKEINFILRFIQDQRAIRKYKQIEKENIVINNDKMLDTPHS